MPDPSPLLALDHEWHRQRASLRTHVPGRSGALLRPPPLVAAGLELEPDPTTGRRIRVGGLVVIFGHFPATFADFVTLARARLHLQPEQARELDAILNTRMMALWAWLPTERRDCYLELDRATGDISAWLVGPGPGDLEVIDMAAEQEDIDSWFLAGLVLNGHAHWGGESGLARLVERFGRTTLLTAAQIADRLEHEAEDPQVALALAQTRWPQLDDEDELPWAALAERTGDDGIHPFARVQLGRVALRIGLLRAARVLLASAAGAADVSPIAWFDLGQACEALDDLAGAENSFIRYATARPQDPDAWRRLLFCRVKRDRLELAEECLRKYHGAGGKDDELVERMLHVVARGRLRGEQRGRIAGFLVPRLDEAFAGDEDSDVVREIVAVRFADDPSAATVFAALADRLREQLAASLRATDAEEPEILAEELLRVALLTLPFLGPPHADEEAADARALAGDVQAAVNRWAEDPSVVRAIGDAHAPLVDGRPLLALAAMSLAVWADDEDDS
jgi:tetratricopeptide (TPR) repeat protein